MNTSKGFAVWCGPELAEVIGSLARRNKVTPQEQAKRLLEKQVGIAPVIRGRGRPRKEAK